MKYTTAIIAASAAAANAQFTINPDGSFTCNSTATANFCVSNSLGTPIIMHCVDGVGEAGNCSDELAGEPPFDVTFGECWQTSATSGDAACEKNCVVYPPNGTPFTLPAALCTPSKTTTSSSTSTPTSLSSPTITPLSSSATSLTSSTTATSTGTSVYTSAGVTVTETFTTTWCPESTLSTVVLPSSGASILYPSNGTMIAAGTGSGSGSGAAATGTGSSPTGSGSGASSNGTVTSASGGKGGSGSSPTATPVGPKSTASPAPSTFTGAATTKSASAALAVIGLAIAYFL